MALSFAPVGCLARPLDVLGVLALGANPEEFQFVGDRFEPIAAGNAVLQFCHGAFINLHHFGAPGANQMVMVTIVPVTQ